MFEFVTGVMNVQYWYAFRFNFVVAHYYGAIVFVASLVLHVALKTPVILRAYRERGVLKPLRDDLARTRPEPARRARRPRRPLPRRADDLAAAACSRSSAPARWRCCWPTSARRSAGRCGGCRCSPRAGR